MPYGLRRSGNQIVVFNKETGDVKGTFKFPTKKYPNESSARAGANAQRRLLYGVEHGMKVRK